MLRYFVFIYKDIISGPASSLVTLETKDYKVNRVWRRILKRVLSWASSWAAATEAEAISADDIRERISVEFFHHNDV